MDSQQEAQQALDDQQQLAEASLGPVFGAYDDALQEGVDQPVVFVIDCEDPLGAEISRAWLGDEVVDNAIAAEAEEATEGDAGERTTVFVAAFAYQACRDEAPKVFPYLAEVFAQPPGEDGVLVVSVTGGGASALTAPWDARPE